MQNAQSVIVVFGTGGTIAGTAAEATDHIGYRAAQIGARALVAALPELAGLPIEVQQLAQLDSKDMSFAVWRRLAQQVGAALERPDVGGVLITHGTDTLEETAYFLQRVLAPRKPVALVAAMRPASARLADGPQNLLDAVSVLRSSAAQGVVAVLAGTVHSALDLRKAHTYRLDAFDSGDAGPIAHVEQGRVRRHREWPTGSALGLACLPADESAWPRVEIVTSRAGSDAMIVEALRAAGVQGIVVAGAGNGSVHHVLEAALLEAQAADVAVLRSTRCMNGTVIDAAVDAMPPALKSSGALTPVQARIELMLQLLARGAP